MCEAVLHARPFRPFLCADFKEFLADCYGNSHYVRAMRNFLRTTLLACVLSLWPVVPGSAGPYEDGLSVFKRGDYATALRLWRPLAEQGDASAQCALGIMYDRGLGVPRTMRWR